MIFSDLPFYEDIKREYEDVRRDGNKRADTVKRLTEKYEDMLTLGAEDDGLILWIALADSQYRLKELSSEVAEKAKEALDIVPSEEWKITKAEIERRRRNYAQAPMEERALRKTRPPFNCNWADGDTFAYRIYGDEGEKAGLPGQYMVIRQVGAQSFDGKKFLPLVTVSFWGSDKLPENSAEFMEKPILLLKRSHSLHKGSPLCEYRAMLSVSGKRVYDRLGLVYLGNFADVPYPPVHSSANLNLCPFIFDKFVDETFVRMISQDQYYKTH